MIASGEIVRANASLRSDWKLFALSSMRGSRHIAEVAFSRSSCQKLCCSHAQMGERHQATPCTARERVRASTMFDQLHL
ncbi:g6248 [Coccomyxa elongata]